MMSILTPFFCSVNLGTNVIVVYFLYTNEAKAKLIVCERHDMFLALYHGQVKKITSLDLWQIVNENY